MSFDQIFMRRTPYKSDTVSKFLFFGLGFQRALKKFSIAGFLRVTDSNFQPKYFFPKLFQILKRCLQTLAPETCYSRCVLKIPPTDPWARVLPGLGDFIS